ncbi:R3H domain containing-like [Conger conger]|uniref:R3H domain containing-like n=1 Tax=Conger conger TaxID=82655 RepID=UPI002A5AAE54|nr:R3H domain containing-like [Conger conger]
MRVMHAWLLFVGLLWMILDTALSSTTDVKLSNSLPATDSDVGSWPRVNFTRSRHKRHISSRDLSALLDYHNRVRSQVFPPAANMEYMVWDKRLAKAAESWASQCIWDHGPGHVMRYMGQNLSINSGRYRSVIDLVRSWREEKNSFAYPSKCSAPVCSHYTQMVWATSNKIGCAINWCSNMNVYGSAWKQALILVCNYSIKGNWIGEAPYRTGRPCSACPSSYGGSCSRNLCSAPNARSNKIHWS